MKHFAILLGRERSGTTVMESCIDHHPEVCCFGECFYPEESHDHLVGYYQYFIRRVLEQPRLAVRDRHEPQLLEAYLNALSGAAPYKRLILLNLKYHQFFINPYIGEVIRRLNIPLIHCIRQNVLATHVSHLQMINKMAAQQVIHSTERISSEPVNLDCRTLLSELSTRVEEISSISAGCSGQIRVTLTYELDLETRDGVTRLIDPAQTRLRQAFDLADHDMLSRLSKQGETSLRARIQNVDEVEATLRDTAFAGLLG